MAKFSLTPVSANLKALNERFLSCDDDAQRDAMNTFFASTSALAQWEFGVQLCTDLRDMPIEDASVEWPTSQSPYQPVATLVIAQQVAWDFDRT